MRHTHPESSIWKKVAQKPHTNDLSFGCWGHLNREKSNNDTLPLGWTTNRKKISGDQHGIYGPREAYHIWGKVPVSPMARTLNEGDRLDVLTNRKHAGRAISPERYR